MSFGTDNMKILLFFEKKTFILSEELLISRIKYSTGTHLTSINP